MADACRKQGPTDKGVKWAVGKAIGDASDRAQLQNEVYGLVSAMEAERAALQGQLTAALKESRKTTARLQMFESNLGAIASTQQCASLGRIQKV